MKRAFDTPLLHLLFGGCILLYVLYRSIHVAITYDEAWTILDFVPASVRDILSCSPCDANNHLLNTLLIKAFFLTGSRSEFIARLPNLLALLLYLYHAHRIGITQFTGYMRHVVFILLLANPFMLDLFGLARGYGIALGFQITSIHWFLLYVRERSPERALIATALAAVAAVANLTFLNYFLAIVLGSSLTCLLLERKQTPKILTGNILIGSVLAALLYIPIRELLKIDAFYYGGTSGLFNDTLRSLTSYTLYEQPPDGTSTIILTIFLLALIGLGFAALARTRNLAQIFPALLLIAITIFLSILAQHHLLGTKFVIDRGTLFLYPLIILLFCSALHEWPYPRTRGMIAVVCVFCFGLNLIQNMNLYKAILWDHEAHTPAILDRIEQRAQTEGRTFKIAHSWPLRSALRYYTDRRSYPHLEIMVGAGAEEVAREADIYILIDRALITAPYAPANEPIDPGEWETLYSPGEDVRVLMRPALNGGERRVIEI